MLLSEHGGHPIHCDLGLRKWHCMCTYICTYIYIYISHFGGKPTPKKTWLKFLVPYWTSLLCSRMFNFLSVSLGCSHQNSCIAGHSSPQISDFPWTWWESQHHIYPSRTGLGNSSKFRKSPREPIQYTLQGTAKKSTKLCRSFSGAPQVMFIAVYLVC